MYSDEHLHETISLTSNYEVIADLLKILLKADYECQVYEEETGVVLIKFNHSRIKNYGNPHLRWVTEEEEDILDCHRAYKQETESSEEVPNDLKGFIL